MSERKGIYSLLKVEGMLLYSSLKIRYVLICVSTLMTSFYFSASEL